MYSGQTQVSQDDFHSYIKAGLDLSIHGLGERTPSVDEPQSNTNEMDISSKSLTNISDSQNLMLSETFSMNQNNLDSSTSLLSKIQCHKCNYSTKNKCNIKKHIKSVHEQVKFPCNTRNFIT